MKASLYFLFLLMWLTLNGQSNQKSAVSQPVITHTQSLELLLQEHAPKSDMMKKSLKSRQIPPTLRSISAQKQQLDSIVGPLEKEIFAYNAQQNLILYITISRDTIGSPWTNNTKEEYSFNANGNPISTIISQWNDTTKTWVFKEKSEYFYNSSGHITSEVNSVWVKAQSQWRGDSKTDMTYDNNGYVTLYWGYKWDTDLNNWINASKTEYTYNAQKQTTQILMYSWDNTNSKWIGDFKMEYVYNAAGEIKETISSEWDSVNDVWILKQKSEYTYNDKKQYTQIIYSNWKKTSSTWINFYMSEYGYDTQGNEISFTQSSWNDVDNKWEYTYKNEWTYDSNGNETLYSNFQWNEGVWLLMSKTESTYTASGQLASETSYNVWLDIMSSFMSIDKTEYSYDGSGNTILIKESEWSMFDPIWKDKSKEERIYNNSFSYADLVLPYIGIVFNSGFSNEDDSELFKHMLTEVTITNYDMGVPTEYISKLYYSLFSGLDIYSEKSTNITIYPNPASESIILKTNANTNSDLNVYNLAGELILNQPITGNAIISVNQFTPGIYLFRITTGGQLIYAEKVIIK